jgi:hypothetical protein
MKLPTTVPALLCVSISQLSPYHLSFIASRELEVHSLGHRRVLAKCVG